MANARFEIDIKVEANLSELRARFAMSIARSKESVRDFGGFRCLSNASWAATASAVMTSGILDLSISWYNRAQWQHLTDMINQAEEHQACDWCYPQSTPLSSLLLALHPFP